MNITLYVPEELGKRIEAEKEQLNLSRIFQDAVEDALLNLQILKEDGMERLLATKEKSDKMWFENGERYGMRWALNNSDYDELTRVAKLAQASIDSLDGFDDDVLTEQLLHITQYTREELFGKYDEEVPNTDAYVRGFLGGALEVYARVGNS